MVEQDIQRADRLLQSARTLFIEGDLPGVCGLAYQAFEAAMNALNRYLHGVDAGSHTARQAIARDILGVRREDIAFLWTVRNVDFYGNEAPGRANRELSRDEVQQALATVERVVRDVRARLGH